MTGLAVGRRRRAHPRPSRAAPRGDRAVLAQDYPGGSAPVVYDGAEPDQSLTQPGCRGAPTTGRPGWPVPATPGSWRWTPISSLSATTMTCGCRASCGPRSAPCAAPDAEFASCAIAVECSRASPRPGWRAGPRSPTHDLLRSRMVMVHSSTYLAAGRRCWRNRAGRRGHPGQPERGLGPGPAGGPPAPDRERGPAAGPGGLGGRIALLPEWETKAQSPAVDARSPPGTSRPTRRGGPGLRAAGLRLRVPRPRGRSRAAGPGGRCGATGMNAGCRSPSRWRRARCPASGCSGYCTAAGTGSETMTGRLRLLRRAHLRSCGRRGGCGCDQSVLVVTGPGVRACAAGEHDRQPSRGADPSGPGRVLWRRRSGQTCSPRPTRSARSIPCSSRSDASWTSCIPT